MIKESKVKQLVVQALFAAMCTVATMLAIPSPFGYMNAGDVCVLLCAFTLGPIGAISAGVGSALADLINGYAVYVPATLIIKALMAISAFYVANLTKTILPKPNLLKYAIGSVFAELIMAFGYLFYESVLLGYGAAALVSLPFNLLQGAFGCIGFGVLFFFFKRSKLAQKIGY